MEELEATMRRVEDAFAGLQASEASLPWNPNELEAVGAAIERALALARFEVPDERDGPFYDVDFGSTPQEPQAPIFPAFVAAWTTVGAHVAALMESLEAAGRIEIAAEKLLVYAKRAA